MPKVSVNILTKNRADLLKRALQSVESQNFTDYEVVIIDDGSTDNTGEILKNLNLKYKIISHQNSLGITTSRQEALQASTGEYIAVLDDDDQWLDAQKLTKQVGFLDSRPDYVLVGGGIKITGTDNRREARPRPETDAQIRRTMLLRNNFFTSTVMFRKSAALAAGGFISDGVDLAEDYDLWLRMGRVGKMYNFPSVFASYRLSAYNKEIKAKFFSKQLRLIEENQKFYPFFVLSKIILSVRINYGL